MRQTGLSLRHSVSFLGGLECVMDIVTSMVEVVGQFLKNNDMMCRAMRE